jgi:hypothetical protein
LIGESSQSLGRDLFDFGDCCDFLTAKRTKFLH